MPRFIIPGRRMNQEIYASRLWLGHEEKWNDEEVSKMYTRWIEHVTNTIPRGKTHKYIFSIEKTCFFRETIDL